MMKKSSKAYKTIGEVAEMLELNSIRNKKNTHTIRYWEGEFKQVKPIIINKRRYYDDKNIDLLKKIKFLLKDKGMTIHGAKKQLNEDFFDIDQLIENDQQMKVTKIFETKGEVFFREIEKKITLNILKNKRGVIALGGGAFINRTIKKEVLGNHLSFWLDWDDNTLINRIKNSKKRPLAYNLRKSELIEMMKNETIDGKRLIDMPVYRDKLMRVQAKVMAFQSNSLRVLSSKLNKNQDCKIASMIQKLVGTELRHELEGLAIDVMGDLGTLYEDSPNIRDHGSWQFTYMYYLGLIIGGGTNQIQKNIISERGLGMPREPKAKEA